MIPNQIDHRRNFRQQKARGEIADNSRNRHKAGLPAPQPPRRRPRPPQQRPVAGEEKMTLAERLGIKIEPQKSAPKAKPKAKPTPAKKAEPLEDLAPPTSVQATPVAPPDVVADPPQSDGELPPIADAPNIEEVPAPVEEQLEETEEGGEATPLV